MCKKLLPFLLPHISASASRHHLPVRRRRPPRAHHRLLPAWVPRVRTGSQVGCKKKEKKAWSHGKTLHNTAAGASTAPAPPTPPPSSTADWPASSGTGGRQGGAKMSVIHSSIFSVLQDIGSVDSFVRDFFDGDGAGTGGGEGGLVLGGQGGVGDRSAGQGQLTLPTIRPRVNTETPPSPGMEKTICSCCCSCFCSAQQL